MKRPHITPVHVDWDAVAADVRTFDAFGPQRPGAPAPTASAAELMADLNRATGEHFARVAASPVPVLLPFDTAAFLHDRTLASNASQPAGATMNAPLGNYLSNFDGVPFFYPGPGGYDAVVVAHAQDLPDLGISYPDPIYIHIGGSALLYELAEPVGLTGSPVTGMDDIAGLRRLSLENYVRYTFVRYRVPYVVAIDCVGGGLRARKISCRDADKIALRLLKALRVVGGTPQAEPEAIAPDTLDRPAEQSGVFTYHSPGDLIPGTGYKGQGGAADYTVYAWMRFPIADAPAFANSQTFMSGGDCDGGGKYSAGVRAGIAAYRCHLTGETLVADEGAAENYSYPWRDNFCEMREFAVGQCPGGFGHQGQDIRPASCRRAPGSNRCEAFLHDAVAVRDGAVLRAVNQPAVYLVVNAPNERIRFRYLHMLPRQMDADGLLSGRLVHEGEVIGQVGNFYKREHGTSYHLHFDIQVPTKYGWVFVNPYMTLVAAYERLIRGRGREIGPEIKHEANPMIPDGDAATGSIPGTSVRGASQAPAAKPTEIPAESPPTMDSEDLAQ